MKRTRVDVKNEYKRAYYVALMWAWFQWDEQKLEEVKATLAHGFTNKDIDTLIYFNPSFFASCVKRMALPPPQLYWRVRAVYISFGSRVSSQTGRPFFDNKAWQSANMVFKEILKGYYSDPPGFDHFYTVRLNDDGTVKRNKYGMVLINCNRGTNDVENAHRIFKKAFSKHGVEYGSCLMLHRMNRSKMSEWEKSTFRAILLLGTTTRGS